MSSPPAGGAPRGGSQGPARDGAWPALLGAGPLERRARAWLELVCGDRGLAPGARRALLVARDPESGQLRPLASWPEGEPPGEVLTALLDRSLREGRGMAEPDTDTAGFALSVLIGDVARPSALLGLEITANEDALAPLTRSLRLGSLWLVEATRAAVPSEGPDARLGLEAAAAVLEAESPEGACQGLATVLADRLDCERVTVGLGEPGRMRVAALSHASQLAEKLQLVRDLEEALCAATDPPAVQLHPPPEGEAPGSDALARLADDHGIASALSVPLVAGQDVVGALLFERARGAFPGEDAKRLAALGRLLGPLLMLRRGASRSVLRTARDAGRRELEALFGPGRVARKLGVALPLLAIAFLALYSSTLRVTADAELEGAVRRALVAPFNGFVKAAHHRAGDVVDEGALLVELEDRDLRLERLKWSSQQAQHLRELDEAMAEGDRASVNILSAQVEQTRAQLALLDGQLARTRVVAPFQAVITEGDLSQSLGSAVRRGETLLELAPLDRYRVALDVDERDIAEVAPGQGGNLVLSALPDQEIPIRVTRIASASTAEEGRNTFRVEAQLEGGAWSERLRPGMRGVGRVEVGSRSLLSILTRRAQQWWRVQAFSWNPL